MAIFGALVAGGITVVLVTHEHDIAAWAARQVEVHDGVIRSDRRPRVRAEASA
jgi:putative ABC transport system ATP-binding protein